jgi:ATP-dependent Clp protease, protease subunit
MGYAMDDNEVEPWSAGPLLPGAEVANDLLRRGIVFLFGALDDAAAATATAQLLYLDSAGFGEIRLHINSSGGSNASLFALYDTMRSMVSDVSTVCLGKAAGAGAVLLAAGSPGRRLATPNARVVLEEPYSEMTGPHIDVAARAHEVLRERRAVAEMLARHTGRPLEEILERTKRPVALSAAEALDFGIVDAIVEAREIRS